MLNLNRPTVPEVFLLVKEYYLAGNSVGGNLHIVFEDGNLNDKDVEFCLDEAQKAGDEKGVHLAKLLLQMSKTQRGKLCNLTCTI